MPHVEIAIYHLLIKFHLLDNQPAIAPILAAHQQEQHKLKLPLVFPVDTAYGSAKLAK
jgi:hypothetical protein